MSEHKAPSRIFASSYPTSRDVEGRCAEELAGALRDIADQLGVDAGKLALELRNNGIVPILPGKVPAIDGAYHREAWEANGQSSEMPTQELLETFTSIGEAALRLLQKGNR